MEIKSEDKVFAGLSHLGILFGMLGMLASLVIWWAKTESDFVRHNAKQAFFYQLVVMVLLNIAAVILLGTFTGFGLVMNQPAMPADKLLIIAVIGVAAYIYAVVGAIQSFRGRDFKYAYIGDMVQNLH